VTGGRLIATAWIPRPVAERRPLRGSSEAGEDADVTSGAAGIDMAEIFLIATPINLACDQLFLNDIR